MTGFILALSPPPILALLDLLPLLALLQLVSILNYKLLFQNPTGH